VNLLCESDERRKTYQVIVEDVQARHRGLFPHPGLFDFDAEESAVTAIYNKLQDAASRPTSARCCRTCTRWSTRH
jgi:type I restriction enzyme R subunit